MPTQHQHVIDNRGFFFVLPKLGLPDPGSGWVTVMAAVGVVTNGDRIVKQLQGPIKGLEERKPAENCEFLSVDFQGGTWLLPKVAPQSSPSIETEIFAVKVKRSGSGFPQDHTRLKLADDQNVVCIPGPADFSARRKAFAKLKEDHKDLYNEAMAWVRRPSPLVASSSSSSQRQPTAAELDIERGFSDWEVVSGSSFTPEFTRAMRAVHGEDIRITQGILPDPKGDIRGLTYAVRQKGDTSPIREEEWKHLPANAMVPGLQRYHVNLVRRMLAGKGPLPPPPASSAKSTAWGKG